RHQGAESDAARSGSRREALFEGLEVGLAERDRRLAVSLTAIPLHRTAHGFTERPRRPHAENGSRLRYVQREPRGFRRTKLRIAPLDVAAAERRAGKRDDLAHSGRLVRDRTEVVGAGEPVVAP